MRTVMRPRYYCDHCKKAGGNAAIIRAHEASCTNNPDRICKMCGTEKKPHQLVGPLLGHGITQEDWKRKMAALRELTNECPCCILAAIRQSGILGGLKQTLRDTDPDGPSLVEAGEMRWKSPLGADEWLGFNFREEARSYLSERNEARAGEGMR